jgi:hypothetical protein
VSLPWNRRLRLRVAPDRISANLKAGWPRTATLAEARRLVEPDEAATAPAGGPASHDLSGHPRALAALLQEIASQWPLKGVRLEIELSSALLHLDVVDGDFAGHTDRQLQGIAGACVAEMLGDAVADHEVRWQLQRDDRHLVIAAISRALLSMFQECARGFEMRLARVQPQFVTEWNSFGQALKPGHGVFAVAAARDLAIAAVVDGTISAISIGPAVDIDADDEESPVPVVDRVYSKPATALLVTSSTGTARGAFSPTRPAPLSGTDALDARVDRLLFASGQDPAEQSAFVLVAPDTPSIAASPRWSVMAPRGAQA